MENLEQLLEEFFTRKLPAMSPGARETTAKIIPWLMIVFGGLGLLIWLSSLGVIFGVAGMHGFGMAGIFVLFYMVITPIIQVIVIYGGYLMLSRQRKGWYISFYMLLFGFIMQLLSLSVLGIILDFIFAYLLFQTKEYFDKYTA